MSVEHTIQLYIYFPIFKICINAVKLFAGFNVVNLELISHYSPALKDPVNWGSSFPLIVSMIIFWFLD